MKRAQIVAVVILGMLVGGQAAFVHYSPVKPKLGAGQMLQTALKYPIGGSQAREIVQGFAPGEIKEAAFTGQHGMPMYSFDIRQAGKKDITEVNISTTDGSIVRVKTETPAVEAAEMKQKQMGTLNGREAM